jgi:ADP-heptose:LPS heptosyltransferase
LSKPSRKILVLSISRMGDIVQSIPFFRRLELRHPGSEIHVLVEECFADVAEFLPHVNRIATVRLEDLLPDLSSGRSHNLARATTFYRGLVAELRAEQYGEVWNLTHTRPSMVLNALLAGHRGCGVTLDRDGLQKVNSPWLIYFFATNLARPWCQFNLVDIYANCVTGVDWAAGRNTEIVPPGDSPLPPGAGDHRIAVHAGASQATKQWPLESFRRVVERLVARGNVSVVLIGGRRDESLATAFQGIPRVTSLIGKTTPRELAAVLAQSRVLLSNDSGPMHVAAAVKTPVIVITIGSALGSETAPYGDGHWVIEPDSPCFPCSAHYPCQTLTCGQRITTETVAALTEYALGWRSAPSLSEISGSRIYRTRFSKSDELLELERMFGAEACERDRLHDLIRPAWLSILEDRPPSPTASQGEVHDDLRQQAQEAVNAAVQTQEQALRLAHVASRPPLDMLQIERLGEEVRQAETRLDQRLNGHGLLRSFQAFAAIARASLNGDGLAAQARETARIYGRVERLLSALSVGTPKQESKNSLTSTVIEASHENRAQWV